MDHQNVRWYVDTLSIRYMGWDKLSSIASNFALASRLQLRNGKECGESGRARTHNACVHRVQIFAESLLSMQPTEAAFEVRSSTSLWKTCVYPYMTSLLPFSGFCLWLPATEMNSFQIAWKVKWHFRIILEQGSHSKSF